MKKVIWGILITVGLVGTAGWYLWNNDEEKNEEPQESSFVNVEEPTDTSNDNELSEEEKQEHEEYLESLNPFGHPIEVHELADEDYQSYINAMAHQKVKAEEKWGFYEITDERIEFLLEGLSESTLEHADLYRGILERWSSGDFSQVVEDHNSIWRLQGGEVGEATGVYSEIEERAYIASQKANE